MFLRDLRGMIAAGDTIAARLPDIAALPGVIADIDGEAAGAHIRDLERDIASLPGTNDLRGALRDARRNLTGRSPSVQDALQEAAKALRMARDAAQWRQAAAKTMQADLDRLEAATRQTFGLRQQDRLTRDQALEVAACLAIPPDVSLRF